MNKAERAERDRYQEKIATDTNYALLVFRVVYESQAPWEKRAGRHIGHDGVGFRPTEAVSMNALYEELEARGFRLTAEQADLLRERMQPYWRQIRNWERERDANPTSKNRPTREQVRSDWFWKDWWETT